MPSVSLQTWQSVRAASLDEIEEAHRSIGGNARGRRYALQQINYAYAVLLAGQFQGFCRDLHSECAWVLSQSIQPASLRVTCMDEFLFNRKLDRGNPTPGNIGSDFNRLGVGFWKEVSRRSRHIATRRSSLETLCEWRNAIAHQDFTQLGVQSLQLKRVNSWRDHCSLLAKDFDNVMHTHLTGILGKAPW